MDGQTERQSALANMIYDISPFIIYIYKIESYADPQTPQIVFYCRQYNVL